MKRETRIVHVEVSGWTLNIWRIAGYYRAELKNPEGRTIYHHALHPSLERDGGVFESVTSFLSGHGIRHTGVVLVAAARAELIMSRVA